MGNVLVIGNSASGYVLEKPLLSRAAEGWDEVREVVRLSLGADDTSLVLGAARTIAGVPGNWYVQSARETGCQLGMRVVEIVSKGLSSSKGFIAEPTAYTEAVTGIITNIPGAPNPAKGSVAVPRVGVNVRWLSEENPNSSVVGTMVAPPATFGVPGYPILPEPDVALYHFPNGWYLAKRDSQRLPLTALHFVFDYYVFQPTPTYTGA
jgi:hypothetical protein